MAYDLMVIGGGTGGLRLSLSASSKGYNTLLFEPGMIGGTCLNTGCIPTKAMLHASHTYRQIQEAKELGITASPKVNFKKLMQRVRSFPEDGRSHIEKSLRKDNLTVVRKPASFIDEMTVEADGKEYTAKKIVIATGASNFIPPVKGLEDIDYLDNKKVIYDMDRLPKSIIMVGGGYISMEFATFFAELGSQVTVLELMPDILAMLDEDVRTVIHKRYEKSMDIITNAKVLSAKNSGGKVKVTYADLNTPEKKKHTKTAHAILVATGRVPNTKGLDLEKTGVKTNKRGAVLIDKHFRTSNKNIFAIGDVIGKAMFAHAVKRQTYMVLENALKDKKWEMDFDQMPWAVFTHPPVAGIGLSEQKAQDEGIEYELQKAQFSKAGRAAIVGETAGFVKVLVQPKTKKILGAQIVGPNADDIIHEFVALMRAGAKIDVVHDAIHVHPTLSEVLENLR